MNGRLFSRHLNAVRVSQSSQPGEGEWLAAKGDVEPDGDGVPEHPADHPVARVPRIPAHIRFARNRSANCLRDTRIEG
jgi:hypothetical protein